MKKLILLLFGVSLTLSHAQQMEVTQQQNDYVNTVFMTPKKDYSDAKVQWSPYYQEQTVLYTPFKKVDAQPQILLKNAFNDEIEIKDGADTYSLNIISFLVVK